MEPQLFYKVVVNTFVINEFFKESGFLYGLVSIVMCIIRRTATRR